MVVELITTPPSLMTYTLILRGERFELSHSQVTTDSPNYLQGRFLAGSQERTVSADRKPDVFRTFILEHLSGYDIFPLEPFKGMSKKHVAKAVLVEAEFFKLKKLAEKAKEALDEEQPTMLLPYPWEPEPGAFSSFDAPRMMDFSQCVKNLGPLASGITSPSYYVVGDRQLLRFHNLQINIAPRGATFEITALFLDPAEQKVAQERRTNNDLPSPIPLKFEDFQPTQASVTIDGAHLTLEALLQWAAHPSPQTAKITALKPLNDIFHPEVTSADRRSVTLFVRSAVGFWSGTASLSLMHLTIFSEEQGFSHLDRPIVRRKSSMAV